MSNIKKLIKKYFCLMHAICNVLVVYLQTFKETPRYTLLRQRLRRVLGAVGWGVTIREAVGRIPSSIVDAYRGRGIRNWGLLSWLIIANSCVAHDDKKIIDHLLESSTKHVFNVDQESFLLKMIYDNSQLVYRAVYPFTHIETPGTYRISTMVNNNLSINTSNVMLDLNGNTISGQVTIAANLENITIKNGVIDTTTANGLLINSGCSGITLSDLTVRNATRGINANGLIDSIIIGCDLSRNTTGLQLDTCHNITVQECNAISNLNVGFCLLTSTTCTFIECQALSTGENNNETANQTIVGFVSANGNGNIFERCIANCTQGLSVTDSESVVAGFALRGSENASSICECTAANATTSANGVTVPYGIFLESYPTLTYGIGENPGGGGSDIVYALDWSPDGNYLVAGGGFTSDDLLLYKFDRISGSLIQIDSILAILTVYTVVWSPCGTYLAVAGAGSTVFVYRFDPVETTLAEIDVLTNQGSASSVYALAWSPDGHYLAVGTVNYVSEDNLILYYFNPVTQKFSFVQSNDPQAANFIYTLDWSPDSNYLAIGLDNGALVYDSSITTTIASTTITNVINTAKWSPDGKYLALGGETINANPDLWIYEFTGTNLINPLNKQVGSTQSTNAIYSVDWSSDGKYLAVGLFSGDTSDDLFIYEFDRSNNDLINPVSAMPGGSGSNTINAVSWSPDGTYLAAGGSVVGTEEDLWIYPALSFPSNNVINNNKTYCNSGGSIPSGIGISGSSIANLMMGNTSFDNPIDPFMVYNNYAFVTNVYNQNFGTPNILQNLSFGSTDPIQIPDDTILRLERSISKACDIQTKVDILLSIYG